MINKNYVNKERSWQHFEILLRKAPAAFGSSISQIPRFSLAVVRSLTHCISSASPLVWSGAKAQISGRHVHIPCISHASCPPISSSLMSPQLGGLIYRWPCLLVSKSKWRGGHVSCIKKPSLHLRTPVSSLVFLPGERGLCFLTRSIFPSCSPDHLAHLLHTMSCSATSPMSSFFSSNIFNPLALTVSSFYL